MTFFIADTHSDTLNYGSVCLPLCERRRNGYVHDRNMERDSHRKRHGVHK